MSVFGLPRGLGIDKERPLATARWGTAEDVARFALMNTDPNGAALQLGFFPHPEFVASLEDAQQEASRAWARVASSGRPSVEKALLQRQIEEAFADLYVASCYPVPLNDDRHCLTLAGTRSGKGASSLIPNLCLYQGSAVVLDPKGENAIITAERRGPGNADWCEGMGQDVLVLDPYDVTKGLLPDHMQASFNPLDLIDPDSETFVEEVNSFADALIVPSEGDENKHFDEMARRFIAAVIFYAFCFPEFDKTGKPVLHPDLVRIRMLLMRGDRDAAEAERRVLEKESDDSQGRIAAIDPLKAMLRMMLTAPDFANGAMANDAGALRNTGEREFGGIVTTAARATAFIDTEKMQKVLRSSDFRPEQIKAAANGMTVYICLPPRYAATAAPWMRLVLSCCLDAFQKDLAPPANGRPVLFLLEEFAALGRMKIVEEALGYAAGFGIRLWPVLQDYGQLERLYGKIASSFVGNAGLVEFFGNGDLHTAKLCSDMLGEVEISRQTVAVNHSANANVSTPSDQSQYRFSHGGPLRMALGLVTALATDPRAFAEGETRTETSTEGLHIVPLLRADEVKAVADRNERSKIAIPNGGVPMFLQRIDYYRDPRLIGRFRPLPHHEAGMAGRISVTALSAYDGVEAAAERANAAHFLLMMAIARATRPHTA